LRGWQVVRKVSRGKRGGPFRRTEGGQRGASQMGKMVFFTITIRNRRQENKKKGILVKETRRGGKRFPLGGGGHYLACGGEGDGGGPSQKPLSVRTKKWFCLGRGGTTSFARIGLNCEKRAHPREKKREILVSLFPKEEGGGQKKKKKET